MKRGSIALIVILCFVAVLLRGGIDLEKQAFIISMGIDRMEDSRLRVSIQVPGAMPSGSDSSQSASASGAYHLIDCVAYTFQDALELLRSSIPKFLNFSQVLQIVVSEDLARESGFPSILDSLLTARGIRQSAAVVICYGNAYDFISTQKTFLGVRLSEEIKTSLNVYSVLDNIPEASLGEVLRLQRGGYSDPLIPYAVVTPIGDDPLAVETKMGRPLDTIHHVLPPTQESHVEYLGAALLQNGRMVGVLTGMEMLFISFLQGHMHEFTFYAGGTYYRVEQITPARISVDTRREQWKLSVSGNIRAGVLYSGQMDENALRDAFHAEVINVLSKLQALGVDPVGFEGKAVRQYGTLEQWYYRDFREEYKAASVELRTQITVAEAE